jgi:hypothetical protein
MSSGRRQFAFLFAAALAAALVAASPAAGDVFVRFRMLEPGQAVYYVRLGGYIHNAPWYLPKTVWPAGADKDTAARLPAGTPTPWFDLGRHAGDRLHGRLKRAGGVAEFPNVTADFVTDPAADRRRVVIEIATAPNEAAVVKRLEETYRGSLTSFLVSPDPKRDAAHLETASQMTERRLRWAREATGGKRVAPKRLIVQTSFWSPQRAELNVKEAEVLRLLGFNVVGNQRPEVRERFDFAVPGHTHRVTFGPGATRDAIDDLMKQHASRAKERPAAGVPFGFSDEVVCRPPIGDDERALAHFRAWLARQEIRPQTLGVERLPDLVPIETPDVLRARMKDGESAARRVFYYTSRFRQAAMTERLKWHTESLHRHVGDGPLATTLVADHPYFGGSGLGMGMTPNACWGGHPLAADWFDLARTRAVDLIGIEDWMGLQFMYGPNSTWEGFQLMGFQASIFRSGSRGALPVIAWITPSDETNLRLKSASALCQGAKHFFYWTYGPTATSTENYWSDLRSAYDGVATQTGHLAAAEHIVAPGRTRKTRLALLYSISSDLWQPFGYVHMLERRTTYLALVHRQYLVDMLTEEDVEAGRLADYDVLYVTDPCVKTAAAGAIRRWVEAGGHLYGSCAAGGRNAFGEPVAGLADVFGIRPTVEATVQPGRYGIRGALNGMPYLDEVRLTGAGRPGFGAIGVKVRFEPKAAQVMGACKDGSPAVVANAFGRGRAVYVGTCPGISYAKDAGFVPDALAETWPKAQRAFITDLARRRNVPRLVELSHPVVEAGVYDADGGTALVLANFTYRPIRGLDVKVHVTGPVKTVRSVEKGPLEFAATKANDVAFKVDLDLSDIILIE